MSVARLNGTCVTRGVTAALAAWVGLAMAGCGEDRPSRSGPAAQESVSTEIDRGGVALAAPLAPDASLKEALAHPDPFERVARVAEILETATPDRLDEITWDFESAPLAWGDLEYTLFATWWARFDPGAAIAYIEDELRLNHPRVIAEVLRTWGRTDPQAAIRSGWLDGRSLAASGLNPEFVDPLVVGWFESGLPGLEQWITDLDPTSKATAVTAYMRMKLLRDGHRPALEWTRTAPFPPDVQRLLLASGLNIVARQDPKLAVEWLEIASKEGIDVRTFWARIARGWANHEPREAMEWMLTQQPLNPHERIRAIHDVVRLWLGQDEKGLEEWLAERPDEAWADQIRKQVIFNHVKKNRYRVDWPELMRRASEFVNAEARQAEYLWLIQRWKAIDPVPASEWLAENAELLGEKIQLVDQLWAKDREEIDAILGEEQAMKEKSAKTG